MRSLLLAGAVLAALSTSAGAWTQSLLHPEGRDAAAATVMPMPPRYSGYNDASPRMGRRAPPASRGTAAPSRPSDPPAWPSCPWC